MDNRKNQSGKRENPKRRDNQSGSTRGDYDRKSAADNQGEGGERRGYTKRTEGGEGSFRGRSSEGGERRSYTKRTEGGERGFRERSSERSYTKRTDDKGNGRYKKPSFERGIGSKKERPESDEMRLNRYIANSGICSRREADELISNGEIAVNGKRITELGTKVSKKDIVVYQGKKLSPESKVYILMNKPKGYVTTVEDPHAEHTVIDLLGEAFPERVYPVGRLDKETTGVLLLTNDGDLTKKLTHPKYDRRKIYHVFLDREVSKNDVLKLADGVDIDGEIIAADAVSCPDPEDRSQLGIEIHSGQNRVVRKMMESLGYKVKKLDRVYFAGLTKKNVQRGKWRFLTDKEVIMLKRGAF